MKNAWYWWLKGYVDAITATLITDRTRCLYKLCPRWRQTRLSNGVTDRKGNEDLRPPFLPDLCPWTRSVHVPIVIEQMALLPPDITSSSLSL